MKIFISFDMEGVAGIVDWSQCLPSGGAAYEPTPVPKTLPSSQAYDQASATLVDVPTRFYDGDRIIFSVGGGVELPFGGVKKSGHGREKGLLALEEMTTTKTLVQWHG